MPLLAVSLPPGRALEREIAMKTTLPALLAATLLLSAPAWAAETRTIAMAGHGEVKAAPDQVQITAGVMTSAPTAASTTPSSATA